MTNPTPSKSKRRFKFFLYPLYIILPLLGAFLGYQVGQVYFTALSEGRFVKWQRLPDPPEPAEAILTAGTNAIFVRTPEGIFFNQNVQDCLSHKNTNCWQNVGSVDKKLLCYVGCEYDTASSFKVSAPPREYQERWSVQEHEGEFHNATQYIRTAGGEIWVWQWGNFSMGEIGPFIMISCIGLALGFVIGLGLACLIVVKL